MVNCGQSKAVGNSEKIRALSLIEGFLSLMFKNSNFK